MPWQRNLGLESQLQKQFGESPLLLSAVTGKVGTRNDMSGYPALRRADTDTESARKPNLLNKLQGNSGYVSRRTGCYKVMLCVFAMFTASKPAIAAAMLNLIVRQNERGRGGACWLGIIAVAFSRAGRWPT